MPTLDNFGKLGAATIVFYVPILCVSAVLVFRHGFKRDAGWIFLLFLSTARMLGGILLVAAQLVRPVNTSLYTGASTLEAVGLSPLLLATLGFLRTVGQNSFSEGGRMTHVFRFLGVFSLLGLILSVVGGSSSDTTDPDKLSQATTMKHASVILYLVLYILLIAVHVMCWMHSSTLMKHRKTLLIGISAALPFLGIRVLYSVLSSFSGSETESATSPHNSNSLSKFNMASGDWRIFLVMSLIMEYVTVVIYTTVGARIPLQNDYHLKGMGTPSEQYPLHAGQSHPEYFPPVQANQTHSGYADYPLHAGQSQPASFPPVQANQTHQTHSGYAAGYAA